MSVIIMECLFWFVSGVGSAFQPEFVEPITNLTVPVGRDATFKCVVGHLGGYRVSHVTFSHLMIKLKFRLNSENYSQST